MGAVVLTLAQRQKPADEKAWGSFLALFSFVSLPQVVKPFFFFNPRLPRGMSFSCLSLSLLGFGVPMTPCRPSHAGSPTAARSTDLNYFLLAPGFQGSGIPGMASG